MAIELEGISKTSPAEVLDRARRAGIKVVDLRFVDLPGTWQHFSVPLKGFEEDVFSEGIGFDGSSIRGFQTIDESDMLLVPDPDSATIDPVLQVPTLYLICNVVDPVTRQSYSRDPRHIAQKAEAYLRSTGIADVSYWGPEAEFYVFNSIRFDQNAHSGYYFIDSDEGIWNSGQVEIDMRFASLTRMADNLMVYKYVIKNVSHQHGYVATFMPKPLFQDNGSGMHCHQSLWKDGTNLFFDEDGYALISETARWYIGGLLKHASALLALCAPTTNSYRRLVPGYEAPINLVYSQRNRSACVRIPVYSTSPKSKRVEFRSPDPSCNPYLAFAAMLMAGLDGIKNRIEPPMPVDKDLYELEGEEKERVASVPGTLAEVLRALEADHEFLLMGDVFTSDVIRTWIEYKWTREVEPVALRPHPWEFYLYHDA